MLDGRLEHFGRKGRKIKLSGFSVEPFEVECELLCQPGVSNAVVVSHQDGDNEPFLVGYVAAPSNISASKIRNGLATRLPPHMVPSHIVIMDSLPMTAGGKIDRRSLPLPSSKRLPSQGYRAPASEDERALVLIWQEILKLSSIGTDDNFFELGGTSLQALLLFGRIKTVLSRNVPPSAIICAPTTAQLAELMRQEATLGTAESLVPFRLSGGSEPLYMMHGNNGSLFYVRHLLTDLNSNRPVYGLQPPPLNGAHRILRTIESMATSYIAEIRRVQPRGPYFLMGYSFGGWVVFEMARQLVQAGEHVNFLGMIDTILRWPPVPSRATRLRSGIQGLPAQQVPLYLLLRVWESLAFRIRTRKRVAALWLNAARVSFKLAMSDTQRSDYYERLCVRARHQYVPRPYSGHLTIFSSAGNAEWQRLCWEPLVQGGLTVLEIPAGHLEMIRPPHSKLLAKKVDDCLKRLTNGSPASVRQASAVVEIVDRLHRY